MSISFITIQLKGCVKITPAHDHNDYEVGMRHSLEFITVIGDDGLITDKLIHCMLSDLIRTFLLADVVFLLVCLVTKRALKY